MRDCKDAHDLATMLRSSWVPVHMPDHEDMQDRSKGPGVESVSDTYLSSSRAPKWDLATG